MTALPIARSCGRCTLCCYTHTIDGLTVGGEWCKHVDHEKSQCGAYETRPDPCRNYRCLWLLGLPGTHEGDRPDRVGVVLSVPAQEHQDVADPGTGRAVKLVLAHERCRGSGDTQAAKDLFMRIAMAGKAVAVGQVGKLRRVYCPSGQVLTPS